MIALLFTPMGRMIAGAAIAMALIGGIYEYGKYCGKSNLQDRIDKATIEAIKTRQGINNEIQALSDYDLCISLGGVRNQCEQLRGVVKNAKP